jgi:hypothetical protein
MITKEIFEKHTRDGVTDWEALDKEVGTPAPVEKTEPDRASSAFATLAEKQVQLDLEKGKMAKARASRDNARDSAMALHASIAMKPIKEVLAEIEAGKSDEESAVAILATTLTPYYLDAQGKGWDDNFAKLVAKPLEALEILVEERLKEANKNRAVSTDSLAKKDIFGCEITKNIFMKGVKK